MTRTKAFTLVELLVVMAIIVLMAAMLVPSLEKAIEYAHITRCISNLKGVGMAMHAYASQYNTWFPLAAAEGNPGVNWLVRGCWWANPSPAQGLQGWRLDTAQAAAAGADIDLVWDCQAGTLDLYPDYLENWRLMWCPNRTQSLSAVTWGRDMTEADWAYLAAKPSTNEVDWARLGADEWYSEVDPNYVDPNYVPRDWAGWMGMGYYYLRGSSPMMAGYQPFLAGKSSDPPTDSLMIDVTGWNQNVWHFDEYQWAYPGELPDYNGNSVCSHEGVSILTADGSVNFRRFVSKFTSRNFFVHYGGGPANNHTVHYMPGRPSADMGLTFPHQ